MLCTNGANNCPEVSFQGVQKSFQCPISDIHDWRASFPSVSHPAIFPLHLLSKRLHFFLHPARRPILVSFQFICSHAFFSTSLLFALSFSTREGRHRELFALRFIKLKFQSTESLAFDGLMRSMCGDENDNSQFSIFPNNTTSA